MAKILVITSGGDWADASCEHWQVLKPFNLEEQKELLRQQHGPFMNLGTWLEKQGLVSEIEDLEYVDEF